MRPEIIFIGKVKSPIKKIEDSPLQENEGAPEVSLVINKKYIQAIEGLKVGSKILILTWLHKANRETLTTRPRNNQNAALTGVFATRSPDRPNPIGLHVAEILSTSDNGEIKISHLEVIDGTPVIDIKPHFGN